MQQQICQQEQLGQQQQQQQQQQVMLCPVRLVYETQILVQPGEQIQPNQTLFINPQNPPPWIQNRAQNQVIYMQQLPNNMMHTVPQQMDQNQMYLQNLQGYYPQQMIQMDQMRQMQNVVQMVPNINNINQMTGHNVNNMGQNLLNVGQNINSIPNVNSINQNVVNVGQNVVNVGQNVQMPNVVQNVSQKTINVGQNNTSIGQNVVNIAQNVSNVNDNVRIYNNTVMPNTIPMVSQTTMTNVAQMQDRTVNMNQNLVNMQKVAELQGMRQQNVRQPQVTVSPMQNVKFVPNSNDTRPVTATNVNDIRPIVTPNVIDNRNVNSPRQMNVSTITNIPNNVVQANAINKKVPLPNKPNPTVMANQVRHYNQTYYRPIQPRPMSVMPMGQNQYLPIGTQTINLPRPNQIINDVNRKRKSESPDETSKKIPNMNSHPITAVPTVSNQAMTIIPNIQNKIVNVVQTDIGINTSPVHREVKQTRTVETASTGTQANIAKEKPQVVEMKIIPPIVKENVQIESDKLVRNTVFTQARGLLRTEPQIMQPDIISIEKIETVVKPPTIENRLPGNVHTLPQIVHRPPETKIKLEEPIKTFKEPIKTETVKEPIKTETFKEPIKTETFKEPIKTETFKEPIKTETFKEPIKTETPKTEALKTETSTTTEIKPKETKQKVQVKGEAQIKKEEKAVKDVPKPVVKIEKCPVMTKMEGIETQPVKTEVKEVKEANKKVTVTSISDFKGEIQIADGSVRKEHTDSFILTHVLDGYVIQESNTAFPIRKPLKEKTIYQNTEMGMEKKEETYKHRTEDGKVIKDNSKILAISDLNLHEDDKIEPEETKEEKCVEDQEDQPFANLKPSTIKSWTIDQLASHLSKYKWSETISVLTEHEIDGESLFLVSKQQLVQIGVDESHADVICEFIKKS